MRLYSFGGLVFANGNGEHSMPVSARSALVLLANGSFDQDGGTGYRKPGQITWRGWIYTGIDTAVDALMSMVSNGRRILRCVMRDGTTYRQTFAKLISATRDAKAGEWDYYQPITLVFEQDYPYWMASADEPVYLDDGYVLDGSWEISSGQVETEAINASPHTFTITNSGGCRVPRGYMLIVPRAGATIEDITISNAANGLWIAYAGSLTDADVLEIHLLSKSIEKNATGDYANFGMGAGQLDWMLLELGDNDITILSTVTGTVDFYWQWSKHYL